MPRHWGPRSQAAYASVPPDAGPSDIVKAAMAALDADDPESLAGLLRRGDEGADPCMVRFCTAIEAMRRGLYRCAYSAWDDDGACWSDVSDHELAPSGRSSAHVMMSVCDAALANARAAADGVDGLVRSMASARI